MSEAWPVYLFMLFQIVAGLTMAFTIADIDKQKRKQMETLEQEIRNMREAVNQLADITEAILSVCLTEEMISNTQWAKLHDKLTDAKGLI